MILKGSVGINNNAVEENPLYTISDIFNILHIIICEANWTPFESNNINRLFIKM